MKKLKYKHWSGAYAPSSVAELREAILPLYTGKRQDVREMSRKTLLALYKQLSAKRLMEVMKK